MYDMKNKELLERISKSEDELRNIVSSQPPDSMDYSRVQESRVYSTSRATHLVPSTFGGSSIPAHEEAAARSRWQNELQTRQLDQTQRVGYEGGFATQSAVWEQGQPASPRGVEIERDDIKGLASAIMHRSGTGQWLYVDTMGQSLANSPYADFAKWFAASVDMEGSDALTINQLEAVVGQYLAENADSTVAQAIQAGGAPESPFVEGPVMYGEETPNIGAAGTRAGDLVSFIQQSKNRESPVKASRGSLAKVMLHMTVEIGDGRSDTIDVRDGDDPRALADAFCRMHDLSVNVVEPLSDHIKANIAQIKTPLSSPKKAPAPPPAEPVQSFDESRWGNLDAAERRVMEASSQRVNGDEVGRRLSQAPTRTPRATMDPSSLMMPATAMFTEELLMGDMDHIDELAMSPQTTQAVRKYSDQKIHVRTKAKPFSPTLDKKSRETAERMRGSRSSKGDVFSRLNREAEDRRRKLEQAQETKLAQEEAKIQDEIKREKLLNGKNAQNAGVSRKVDMKVALATGERLYNMGLKDKEKKEELRQKHLEMRKKKEMEANTGKPKISKMASGMSSRVMKDWDGQERKKRLDELRKKQAADEMAECTFDIKATIAQSEEMGFGARSNKLVTKLVQDAGQEEGDRFEVLYQDAKQRQLRTEQYENWFPDDQTFHPDIGANKERPSSDQTEEEFINRLTYSKQAVPMDAIEDRDITTGQPLFHPRTGRAPLFNRNAADLPIGDYLYASGLELEDEKARRRIEAEQEVYETVNQPKASSNSDRLTEGMRRRRLREIFEMVDTDADGIIDPDSANAAGVEGLLPEDVANEVIPVVMGTGQALDFEQFYQLVSTEISYTQTGPRQYLVPERLRHLRALEDYIMDKEGSPYNPKVSMKSKILAQNQRKHRHGSLHDALSEEGQIWDERRRNASEQKAAQDLAKCTFMPNAHLQRVAARGAANPDEVTRRLSQPSRRV